MYSIFNLPRLVMKFVSLDFQLVYIYLGIANHVDRKYTLKVN